MPSYKPYVEVRALSRGLALLLELNKVGHARVAALARAVAIDRTTTYRLLATLEAPGLVVRRSSDDEYVLAPGVRNLSHGYVHRDHLTRCATQNLGSLFQKVQWPTDFAVFEQGLMVIRETTHRFSPYSIHRNIIGKSRTLFTSALGRAFLAGANEDQRATVLEIAKGAGGQTLGLGNPALIPESLSLLLKDFEARTYAWSVGETEQHISAIALPIVVHGRALGAINMVFFRSAMSVEFAAERFLEPLKACIDQIEAEMTIDPLE